MSAAHEHYPELHDLIERLSPEQAEELRRHALRLVREDDQHPRSHRLGFTGLGASSNRHLAAQAKPMPVPVTYRVSAGRMGYRVTL